MGRRAGHKERAEETGMILAELPDFSHGCCSMEPTKLCTADCGCGAAAGDAERLCPYR